MFSTSSSKLWIISILVILEIMALSYLTGGINGFWISMWAIPLLVVGLVFFIIIADYNGLVSSLGKFLTLIGIGLLFIPLLEFALVYLLVINVIIIGLFVFSMAR